MKNNNKVYTKEAENFCYLTILTMNLLMLVVVGQAIWFLYSIIMDERNFELINFNNFLP